MTLQEALHALDSERREKVEQRGRELISEELTRRDRLAFVETLIHAPDPTATLIAAMERYRKLVENEETTTMPR